MRVGLLAPPWAPVPPPGYGAIETQVHYLAREISAAGHEVLLLATGDSTCPVPRRATLMHADGADRVVSTEVLNVVLAYDALGDVDIVHDHTLAGPLYGHQRGSIVVTTAHWVLEGRIGELYQRMSNEVAVVAVSAAQRSSMQTMTFAATIHHGVELSDFPMGTGTGGYCAVLGRMSPDKGIHIAIEAAQKAGVRVLIAAKLRDGDESQYFETMVRPRLGPDVEYLGELGTHDKLELLCDARALLFPVQWAEPFGMVMIESLACGTPVLAFARGAVPEVVRHGENGFVCVDVAAMAQAIGVVHEIDRAHCRADVARRFSAKRMAAEHLDLYQRLLHGSTDWRLPQSQEG